MVRNISRMGAALAMAASLSMAATPALADGWGGGWGGRGYHHRHHDGGGTAAAIIAGLIGVGIIAAVASSNNKHNRDRDYREGYNYGGVDEDTAVNNCANEVQRNGNGVDSIGSVNRNGNGWSVEGRTGDGSDFSCSVSGNGAVYDLRVD